MDTFNAFSCRCRLRSARSRDASSAPAFNCCFKFWEGERGRGREKRERRQSDESSREQHSYTHTLSRASRFGNLSPTFPALSTASANFLTCILVCLFRVSSNTAISSWLETTAAAPDPETIMAAFAWTTTDMEDAEEAWMAEGVGLEAGSASKGRKKSRKKKTSRRGGMERRGKKNGLRGTIKKENELREKIQCRRRSDRETKQSITIQHPDHHHRSQKVWECFPKHRLIFSIFLAHFQQLVRSVLLQCKPAIENQQKQSKEEKGGVGDDWERVKWKKRRSSNPNLLELDFFFHLCRDQRQNDKDEYQDFHFTEARQTAKRVHKQKQEERRETPWNSCTSWIIAETSNSKQSVFWLSLLLL